jgi:tetratricopeptide (TPR) repeat protein
MRKIILTVLFIHLVILKTVACINEETEELRTFLFTNKKEGAYKDVPYGHQLFESSYYDSLYKEISILYKRTNYVEYLSDKGYVLILQGKYKEALQIYLAIENSNPNRYSTASNIGTIYELLGDNEKALEWINKAIVINKDSHYGSEWLHSKILEAKIKGTNFYNGNFLINTNFGDAEYPKTDLNIAEIKALRQALYYQLNERISFIKPKDEIVAVLLFDLANITYLLRKEYEPTIVIYEMAKEYGFNQEILNKRILLLKKQGETSTKEPKVIAKIYTDPILILCFVITISSIAFAYFKTREY